ncbi:zinc finger BED domain-containing protein [Oryzias melastigma]|uniref:zinc finger BED domain-containing protein n=1 Tax=Oryzias melastigma TaxID=30732 RepID=UPI00168CC421|nr:zinc finger BED domain-containing protein [Oryzias melastigma]
MEAGPKRKFSPTWEYFDMISPTKVKCRICDKEVGYNNNTSSMIRHYRSFHEPGDRSSNDARKQLLDEALVDMVIKDSQPFSVVEDEGFRDFVDLLDPTYILPTKRALKSMVGEKSTNVK